MEAPPVWFVTELAAFDPALRVRWSAKREMFALERRVTRSLHPGTIKGDTEDDDYVRARDGFLLVGHVPPRGLTRYVFESLKANDLWSAGGWDKFSRAVEDAEELEEDAKWKAIESTNANLAKELYAVMQRRSGRVVYNAGWLA